MCAPSLVRMLSPSLARHKLFRESVGLTSLRNVFAPREELCLQDIMAHQLDQHPEPALRHERLSVAGADPHISQAYGIDLPGDG